jgi:hypothetical protein
MSAPEAKQHHTKLVRFRTTFGASCTTGSIANRLPQLAARIIPSCSVHRFGIPDWFGLMRPVDVAESAPAPSARADIFADAAGLAG